MIVNKARVMHVSGILVASSPLFVLIREISLRLFDLDLDIQIINYLFY